MECSFGYLVKEQRQKLKLTQTQVAVLAGLSQQHVSLIEKGTFNPNLNTLRRLGRVLQMEFILKSLPAIMSPWEEKINQLKRFNHWEITQHESLSAQAALKKAGEFLELYTIFQKEIPYSEDLENQISRWKLLRMRLPQTST